MDKEQNCTGKVRVLIADDFPGLSKSLGDLLKEVDGIEIIGQVGSVEQALEVIRNAQPQVVILDIRMPGGNGIEVLKDVKRENPALIVIVFTNYPYPQYRKKCMDAGADYFLDKSNEFNRIPQVMERLVEDCTSISA